MYMKGEEIDSLLVERVSTRACSSSPHARPRGLGDTCTLYTLTRNGRSPSRSYTITGIEHRSSLLDREEDLVLPRSYPYMLSHDVTPYRWNHRHVLQEEMNA